MAFLNLGDANKVVIHQVDNSPVIFCRNDLKICDATITTTTKGGFGKKQIHLFHNYSSFLPI